jgi:ABC-2 type transport system permease protein
MGSLANSLQDLLEDNPALAGWINLTGTDLAGEFAAVILSFVMIAPVILGGAGVGLGVTAGTGDSAWTGEMTVAALAYLPAVLLTGGLAAALYGAAPRLTGIAWLLIVWLSVALFLGGLAGFRRRDIASG